MSGVAHEVDVPVAVLAIFPLNGMNYVILRLELARGELMARSISIVIY
ncbi:MAG: hypothetical protein LAP39_26470 [Acidobacteriia bacterium]|nr:hypothetical protein [Terriglobia bacterium]